MNAVQFDAAAKVLTIEIDVKSGSRFAVPDQAGSSLCTTP